MKLSAFLLNLLCDPAQRASKNTGVCGHVDLAVDTGVLHPYALTNFARASSACKQTDSAVYPVRSADGRSRGESYRVAQRTRGLWRGEYGRNRRKFLRDCVHWLKERGL